MGTTVPATATEHVIGHHEGSSLPLWWSALLVFTASAGTLVLELIAGRLLSPYIGVSLATWTAIIGVVLAGISVGNWLGGRLADSRPQPRLLHLLFLLGAVSTLTPLALRFLLANVVESAVLPLLPRIFLLTLVGFFPPSCLLGLIPPLAIRLTVPDLAHTGRVVGLLYAVSTLGSLAGNFLTGFVLVAYLPVTTIVLLVAFVLGVLGVAGAVWTHARRTRRALVHPEDHPVAARTVPEAKDRAAASLRGKLAWGCAVAALASFCTMLIELSASRVLAPHVGVSLYSWTGIIGVVLAGISVGNWLGGWVADRWPNPRLLGTLLALGGVVSAGTLLLIHPMTTATVVSQLDLMSRIVVITALLFFLPVLLLSTVTPQLIALVVPTHTRVGGVAGRIYAWSTAGAILGTFLTGWWLIPTFGVYTLIFAAAIGVLVLALVVGRLWERPLLLAPLGALALGVMGAVVGRNALTSFCTVETQYYCIRVYDSRRDNSDVRVLVLDHLIHSYVKPHDPSYLGYEHERVQTELTRFVATRSPQPHILLIGGGGYTYPRWVEAFVPQASIDVVEIDPMVTEIAYTQLGLSRETRIRSYNLDGRQFVQGLAMPGTYDLVVQDAVNDLSVPYHLMTKEYNDAIRAILKPDGIYLLTVIDRFENGELMRAALRTLRESFPVVALLAPAPYWDVAGSHVFVLYASAQPLNVDELRRVLQESDDLPMRTTMLPPERLAEYLASGRQVILTDDYAPVDNLISIVFRERR